MKIQKEIGINIGISLLLSIIIVLIILVFSDKYQIDLADKITINKNNIHIFQDLDGDGLSEHIFFILNDTSQVGLIVYKDTKIIDQWNFKGCWKDTQHPFFGDNNNDGTDEVYLFSRIRDTIYLHCIDPLNKKVILSYKPVTKVSKYFENYDYSIYQGILYDLNYDGIKEFYFSIGTGFATKPRNVFRYNFITDSLIQSPNSCALNTRPQMYDIDDDSIPEFYISTIAYGNCDVNRAYTDQYGWFMAFKPDLSFKFPPLSFDSFPSQTLSETLEQGQKFFFIFHDYRGQNNFDSFMALIDKKGTIYKKKNFKRTSKFDNIVLISKPTDNSCIYLFTENEEAYKIDTCLNFTERIQIPKLDLASHFNYLSLDINRDSKPEYIFKGQQKNQLVITDHNFKNASTIALDEDFSTVEISLKVPDKKHTHLAINTEDYLYFLNYGKSAIYRYWYRVLILCAFGIYLLIYFKKIIKEYRRLQFGEAQKKIMNLQLNSFQNNLDPHFTFNILETFGNLIDEQDKQKARFIFTNYNKLLKTVILNSEKVFIPLTEEIDFVKTYLDLEVFRYAGKFNYEINIHEKDGKPIHIPKMLVHIFVENAIKHGIRHLDANGIIKIHGHQTNNLFTIIVEDNGVGRSRAKEYSKFSTKKGQKIIDNIISLHNKMYANSINYKIFDLHKNGKPTGTRINISIKTNNFRHE